MEKKNLQNPVKPGKTGRYRSEFAEQEREGRLPRSTRLLSSSLRYFLPFVSNQNFVSPSVADSRLSLSPINKKKLKIIEKGVSASSPKTNWTSQSFI